MNCQLQIARLYIKKNYFFIFAKKIIALNKYKKIYNKEQCKNNREFWFKTDRKSKNKTDHCSNNKPKKPHLIIISIYPLFRCEIIEKDDHP